MARRLDPAHRIRKIARDGLVAPVLAAAATTAASAPAIAQCASACEQHYQPSMGLPGVQCFTTRDTTGDPNTGLAIVDGALHAQAEHAPEEASYGLVVASDRVPPGYLWSDGVVIDATLRITNGAQTIFGNSAFRAALSFGGADAQSRVVRMWMWPDGVALSSDQNASVGAQLDLRNLDAHSAFHHYRLAADAGAITVSVDGSPALSVPPPNQGIAPAQMTMWLAAAYAGPLVTADIADWRIVYGFVPRISGGAVRSLCAGGSTVLQTVVTGLGPFSYQWRHDGQAVPGAAGAALVVNSATPGSGGVYDCVVAGPCTTLTTDPVTISVCTANCDCSTESPILNVNDFACFLNRYANGDSWANCDGSTTVPVLNVLDFACFLNEFAAGCT